MQRVLQRNTRQDVPIDDRLFAQTVCAISHWNHSYNVGLPIGFVQEKAADSRFSRRENRFWKGMSFLQENTRKKQFIATPVTNRSDNSSSVPSIIKNREIQLSIQEGLVICGLRKQYVGFDTSSQAVTRFRYATF
ncbi:unnamed protein product [Nezara viridula]|uniref:Uncharacterized protein n=1 Tax=Nezara viridula TaxID=85310 RepID=A0A9P0HFN0_NEZVI|nr:unnamed protein product [Nezara viridula]